jgi:hypothetical protein
MKNINTTYELGCLAIFWQIKVFNSISMHFAVSWRDYIPAELTDGGIFSRTWDVCGG